MTEPAPKIRRRGCWFYGCITSAVLLLLLLGAALLGLHFAKKLVNRYTDTQPVEVPTVRMPQADFNRLKARLKAFEAAVREHRPAEPLTLSSDDINALIASVPENDVLKGKIYVTVEGDQLKGQVSVPLQQVGLGMFKGRYLNGTATFAVSLRNGVLAVSPRTVVVKGNPLPEIYMQKVRQENLAAGVANDPQAVAVLQGLEDLQIRDGSLIVVPKEKK